MISMQSCSISVSVTSYHSTRKSLTDSFKSLSLPETDPIFLLRGNKLLTVSIRSIEIGHVDTDMSPADTDTTMPLPQSPPAEASKATPRWVEEATSSENRDNRTRPWQKPLQGIIDDSMDRRGEDKLENSALVEMKSLAA